MSDPRNPRGPEAEAHEDDEDVITTGQESDSDEGLDDAGGEGLDNEGDEDRLLDDDAGTDDGQGSAAPEVAGKTPGRRERTVLEAKRRAKEAEERAERFERELAEVRQQISGRTSAEKEAEERARLELMGPDEKIEYYRRKDREEVNARLMQMEFRSWDATDRSRFESLCTRNDAFAKVSKDVDTELARIRKNGQNTERETIALYLIGKAAVERAGRANGKQRRQGAERIEREKVRSPRGGSDVRAGAERRGSEVDKRRQRLEDVLI